MDGPVALASPDAAAVLQPRRPATSRNAAGVFLLLLILAAGLQGANGAYQADLAGDDETAHYVTGLMIYGYVRSGDWLHPWSFARDYYEAYPRVALGHWPPLFYVVEASWMTLASPGRVSVAIMMACFAAAAGTALYAVARPVLGEVSRLGAAALFLCLPVSQQSAASIMLELPVTFATVLSVIAYDRYLRRQSSSAALGVGAALLAALMTKANALALALLPPLAVLFAGRRDLLTRATFWLPAAVSAAALPWYLWSLDLALEGFGPLQPPRARAASLASQLNLALIAEQNGLVVTLLAVVGLGAAVIAPIVRRQPPSSSWAAIVAACAGWLAFHSWVLHLYLERHLLPALALLTLFSAAGIEAIARRVAGAPSWRAVGALWLVVFGAFGVEAFHLTPKASYGASAVADLLNEPEHARAAVFVASPRARGEGSVIAELAQRAPRPARRIVRATKTLARDDWDGGNYVLLVTDPQAALARLDALGVRYVVVHRPPHDRTPPPPHYNLVVGLTQSATRLRRLEETRSLGEFEVYELRPQ